MKIYLYVEHHCLAGQLARMEAEECENNNDVFLAADGTEDDIIREAIESLATRRDKRPGGAGDSYRWKCDRAILQALNGPEVEYDPELRAYRVVAAE